MTTQKPQRVEDIGYAKHHDFWTRKGDAMTVVGDYIGRVPAIELIDPQPGEKILDAGCGAGWVTRILARKGAKVFGIDRQQPMLNGAIAEETKAPLGIVYSLEDIGSIKYPSRFFDKVACIAALFHNSPEEAQKFFRESERVLRPRGEFVLSLMRPDLYVNKEVNNFKGKSWVKYKKLEKPKVQGCERFSETYRDSSGQAFESPCLWRHPESFLIKSLQDAGFDILKTQSQYVTREVLDSCGLKGPVGYPAFYQILARKGMRR